MECIHRVAQNFEVMITELRDKLRNSRHKVQIWYFARVPTEVDIVDLVEIDLPEVPLNWIDVPPPPQSILWFSQKRFQSLFLQTWYSYFIYVDLKHFIRLLSFFCFTKFRIVH